MSLIGETKREILFFISNNQDTYGYAIAKELDHSVPAVYAHLEDFEEYGIVKSHEKEDRRIYELTNNGEKLIEVLSDV